MAIVYKHIRKDTNQIFYIGIGKSEKRAYSKTARNRHWIGIVNKHGYDVEIISSGLSWNDAQQMEVKLISEYGRFDLQTGILVNQTDGGEGNNNQIFTKETRLKMSKSAIGKPKSEQHKYNMSNSRKGIPQSIQHRENNRLSHLGKTHSDKTKEKLRELSLGKTHSDDIKKNLSIINSKFKYEKYTKDGVLVETYESMYLALISINKSSKYRGIYHAIDRGGSCFGFIWKRI